MKRKQWGQFLAASLAAAVCFTGMNFSPLLQAREVKATELQQEEWLEETKVELPEERTEGTTTFQRRNNSRIPVISRNTPNSFSSNAVLIAVASRALAAVASTPAIAAGSKTFCSI